MQTRTVQVGHVSDLAGEREIHEFFSFSGDIEHVEILRDSGQLRTAFVTFKDPKALEIALLLSDGTQLVQAHYKNERVEESKFRIVRIPKEIVKHVEYKIGLKEFKFKGEQLLEAHGGFLTRMNNSFLKDYLLIGILLNSIQKGIKNVVDVFVLQGATIVDQVVTITPVENYVPTAEREVSITDDAVCQVLDGDVSPNAEGKATSPNNGRVYVNKAQDVVTSMLAKGSAIGQDAMNKAKAFDEKHQLTASASAKVISFDRRVGLTEKLTVGISVVNEKVKSVDQRLHVSDKTMAALLAAERKLNNTGSAVKTSRTGIPALSSPGNVVKIHPVMRYVTAGTTWLNGAFTKVAKAGQIAGTKTREKFHLAVSNLTAKIRKCLHILSKDHDKFRAY
ncbi:Binding partner of ACD11 1 [Vitis vinifera]|uniref:Binding partner of ACD11 1 n=1 Tax=Vitis vinifera TaxID=29760 RepID=A0A438DSL2_VITVI|nr:Binding partner of ACD11 1 [Vitis vinifera]